jgi:hypothetical protein
LHTPIVRLKQESQAQEGGPYLQALRDLFSLDEGCLGAMEQKTGWLMCSYRAKRGMIDA